MPAARRCLAAAALLAALAGCGKGYQPVSGRLVWPDGSAAGELKGSQVVFESAELRFSGRGAVGPAGEFTITSVSPDDGVPAGTYKVGIVEERKVFPDGSLGPGLLDERLYDPEKSGLTAAVTTGRNDVTLTVGRKAAKK